MARFGFAFALLVVLMTSSLTVARAADIAVLDYADQWTRIDALRRTLDEFGMPDAENSELPLSGQKLLILGSMVTNNALIHQSLDANSAIIADFVQDGGIVIEMAQADQNEGPVDWLPEGLACTRGNDDSAEFAIQVPDHPLFNDPNVMREGEFSGWGHQNWPTVWERIVSQEGFDVLADSQGKPAIVEAEFGGGKFVLMALAPDKYHMAGNDDNTKEMAGLFFENIIETYLGGGDPPEAEFLRGDALSDGTVNITDAISVLNHLFLAGGAPTCWDAADGDDNGAVNLTDAVFALNYLFLSGPAFPAPGSSECGPDPTADALGCESHPHCR
jgi:hypothetical protein